MSEYGGEVTFTMRLDNSQLGDLAHMIVAASGAGGGGGGGVAAAVTGGAAGGRGGTVNPSFMSIFKPLATLAVIEKLLGGLVKNSQILNTYQSAMGKMFGAAIDLLLTPFIPLFNLIMVGMSKLIAWLITSGTLEKIQAIMARAAKYLESMAGWLGKVFSAIKDLDFARLAGLLIEGFKAGLSTLVKDPLGVAAASIVAAIVASKASSYIPGLPGGGKGIPGLPGGGKTGGGGGFLKGALGLAKKAPLIGAAVGGIGASLGENDTDESGLMRFMRGAGKGASFGLLDPGKLVYGAFGADDPAQFKKGTGRRDSFGIYRNDGNNGGGNTLNLTQNFHGTNGTIAADQAIEELKRKAGFVMANRN